MEALRFINKINDREIDFLYHLINKNIWSIHCGHANENVEVWYPKVEKNLK